MGLLGDDGKAEHATDPPLPEAPPWTDRELLAGEKETLGFYLTGHPLAAHSALLQAVATHSTATLDALTGETGVVLGGLITAPKKRKSKNGDWWATFQLEDLQGAVEVLMFPRAYAPCAELVQADRTLAERHYDVHKERPFFPSLVQFLTSGPTIARG